LGTLAASFSPREAHAFGQANLFSARLLVVGGKRPGSPRDTAPPRWSWELSRRTSAPARLATTEVAADDAKLMAEPFAVWSGSGEAPRLTSGEIRNLSRFLKLGGMLLVDDAAPENGAFRKTAQRELARVLPENTPIKLDSSHVLYKSYYIVERPVGRVLGEPHLEAMLRGRNAQVIFTSHDLLGALARTPSGGFALETTPGGVGQRERAVRLAVNIGMYLLCSDYKDDQVHAPWLMRRRAGQKP
jgi:hypothetical protein